MGNSIRLGCEGPNRLRLPYVVDCGAGAIA